MPKTPEPPKRDTGTKVKIKVKADSLGAALRKLAQMRAQVQSQATQESVDGR